MDTLLYLLSLRPLRMESDDDQATGSLLLEGAAAGGHLPCLRLLHERGYAWTESVPLAAISGGPECLQYALDHTDGDPREMLEEVLLCKSVSCLQVLYDRGCLARSRQFWDMLQNTSLGSYLEVVELECLKVMVANSGPPPTETLSTVAAASRGPAFLQYIRALGADWGLRTMSAAALASVDTMRYAHENGCPWGWAVMSDFTGNVECLQYAHRNGCPYDVPARSTKLPELEVLQYAWKHMDRDWVRDVVGAAITRHSCSQEGSGGDDVSKMEALDPVGGRENSLSKGVATTLKASTLDWRVPLYLVKEMGMGGEIGFLAQLAHVRLARAAALAQCFYGAGKYLRELRGGRWADAWAAMARCPTEVREKIASDAHLALPTL